MGTYIGNIDIISNSTSAYYNFKPQYELKNGKAEVLLDIDLEKLLPESSRHNINFSYAVYNDREFMEGLFFEDIPVAFEFEPNKHKRRESTENRLYNQDPTGT